MCKLFPLIVIMLFLTTFLLAEPLNTTIKAENSSYWAVGGYLCNESQSEFDSLTEISEGLSDNLSITTYPTSYANSPVSMDDIIDGWSFNDDFSIVSSVHSWLDTHNANINGVLESQQFTDSYYGGYFDGVNDYLTVTNNLNFDIGDLNDYTICVVINYTALSGDMRILDNKAAEGVEFKIKESPKEIKCKYEGSSGKSEAKDTTTIINDGLLHVLCCEKDGDTANLWIDGSITATDTDNIGSIDVTQDTGIGGKITGANLFEGTIKQLGIFNTTLSSSLMQEINLTKSIANLSGGFGIDAFFNHSYDPEDEVYYLFVNTTNTGLERIRIVQMINETHPNSTNYIDVNIQALHSFIAINDLLKTNTDYPLRIYSIVSSHFTFNEISLVETLNDSEAPSIINCTVNNTQPFCGDVVRMQCNITDNIEVFKAFNTVYISFLGFNATQEANNNGDIWFTDFSSVAQFNESKMITWLKTNATDLNGNVNETLTNVNINYTCLIPSAPTVSANSPSTETIEFNTSINASFNCSARDNIKVSNISFYNNVSGVLLLNGTSIINYMNGSAIFNLTLTETTQLLWYCNATDNDSLIGMSNIVNTLYAQPNPPNVTITPQNNYIYGINKSIIISASAIDVINISNISIFINGSLEKICYNNTSCEINFSSTGFSFMDVYAQASNIIGLTGSDNVTYTRMGQPQSFSVTECPSTVPSMLFIGIILIFIMFLLWLGLKTSMFGLLGSILLLVLSWYIIPCINFIGIGMMLISLLMILWYVLKK